MRGCIDEVTEGDEGGGKPNGRSIESGDEDLRVRVEGVCYFEVVGHEGAEPVTAEISTVGYLTGYSDVRTSRYTNYQQLSLFTSRSD